MNGSESNAISRRICFSNKKVWMHTTPTLLTSEYDVRTVTTCQQPRGRQPGEKRGASAFATNKYSIYSIQYITLEGGMSRRFSWSTNNVFYYNESFGVWQAKMWKPWRQNFTVFGCSVCLLAPSHHAGAFAIWSSSGVLLPSKRQ